MRHLRECLSVCVCVCVCVRARACARVCGQDPGFGALVLWCFVFVVTESSTGPIKRFKEMNVAHVGVHG